MYKQLETLSAKRLEHHVNEMPGSLISFQTGYKLFQKKIGWISVSIQIRFSKHISYLFFIEWNPDWMVTDVVCL